MRLRTLVTSFILAALGCAPELASAQQPGQLTRITPTTGLADSSLFVCSDSTKALTRACKFSLVQQRLSFKAFDSLLTTKLNLTSGTITGSPTWSSTFIAATGQRVDSATGAARASGLVGNPAITVSSCTGCGGASFPLLAPNGSTAAPSYSFTNATGNGFSMRSASLTTDSIGVHVAGKERFALVSNAAGFSTLLFGVDTATIGQLGIRNAAGSCCTTNLRMWRDDSTAIFSVVGAQSLLVKGGNSPTWEGGAGNLTIQAGTGNSRRLALQTTTSLGAATTALRFNELQQSLNSTGVQANPGISFAADSTAGFWLSAVGGGSDISVQANRFIVNGIVRSLAAGAASSTAIGVGGTNTGLWTSDFANVIFANSGVQSLTVSGGATTALTGGAGNMTIQGGTGASRTITLQTTSASSAVQTNQVLNNDGSTTMRADSAANVKRTLVLNNGASGANTGPSLQFQKTGTTLWEVEIGNPNDGNLTVRDVVGNNARLTFSNSNRYTTLSDTLFITAPAEASTQSALCIGGGKMFQNAAATCTVSSARFKENIVPVDAAAAWKIVGKSQLHSSTYNERVGGRKAIGIIAEQADSADTRLASRDAKGIITSTNYEEVTSLLLTVVKDQQRQLAFQQKMIDSLGRMVDTLFWKRGSLCNGKACKSEPEIPVHRVLRTKNIRIAPRVEMIRDTSATYTFPRARVVKDSAGVVQVKLLPSREP